MLRKLKVTLASSRILFASFSTLFPAADNVCAPQYIHYKVRCETNHRADNKAAEPESRIVPAYLKDGDFMQWDRFNSDQPRAE